MLVGFRDETRQVVSRLSYEIRVEGSVPPEVLENFGGQVLNPGTMDTTLRADLVDASALSGLLLALRRAGLVLLDVRRVFGGPDEDLSEPDAG
jgi:hypothetical protein